MNSNEKIQKSVLPNIQDVLKNILPQNTKNGNDYPKNGGASGISDGTNQDSHVNGFYNGKQIDSTAELKFQLDDPNLSLFNELVSISKSNDHCIASFSDGSNSSLNPAFILLQAELTTQTPQTPPNERHENTFICKICKCSRASKHALDRHMSVHKKSQPCPYCSKQLKSQGRPDVLRRHLSVCLRYNNQV